MTDNAQRNKAIVREFLTKTFTDRDFTALERSLSPTTSSTTLLLNPHSTGRAERGGEGDPDPHRRGRHGGR